MNEYLRTTSRETATRGATAVEYALIVALIAAVIIVAVGTLGTKTEGLYDNTNTEFTNHGI